VIRASSADSSECYFWSTYGQAELDLLIFKGGKRLGFEFKFSDAPKVTKSMSQALDILKLDQLIVVYPGEKTIPFSPKIRAESLYTATRLKL